VLHVGSLTHRDFDHDDVELLTLVAERVALAIERAQLHEEALALDQLKLNFVAIASHELRTPATSVYGALATVVERGDDLSPELRDQLLRMGLEQGERLRRLVEELLDLSRLDSNVVSVDPRPIVLRALLEEIATATLPPGTVYELDVPGDLAVLADRLVLDRVVSNLLTNAVRYGVPPIVVAAERRDRYLRISVGDQGAGVPDDLRPRLFERFARGTTAAGSGLGLSIARSYARAHGGDLVYEHDRDGPRFELIVPQA
jgi:signal transduction histidine kinase